MAFNPFHGFRKYRKTMFAVLTILCMFVFVLSSGFGGRADIFNRNWLGGSRYPTVAKIDGRSIDTQELRNVTNQRRLADDFIKATLTQAHFNLANALRSHLQDFPEFVRKQISDAIEAKEYSMIQPRSMGPAYAQSIPNHLQFVQIAISILDRDKKTTEADLLRRFQQMMLQDRNRVDYYGELYFGGGVRSGQDLLDFLVWKWAADKRNIHLSTEAVQAMFREEVASPDVDEAAKNAEKALRERYKGVTIAGLLEALNDEFRVRLAKAAVIGETSKMPNTVGAYVTPYEFYKYFKDMRTSIRVNLLPVAAESYLGKVTESPAPGELEALFKKHRNEEPKPSEERPGFKEPRKAKIEWIGFKGDEPSIKKTAMEDSAKKSVRAQAVAKAIMAPPGDSFSAVVGRLGAIAVVNDPKLIEKRTDERYQEYAKREKSAFGWMYPGQLAVTIHDRSVYQPRVIAGAIGGALGARDVGGSALSIYGAISSQVIAQEIRERIRFGLFPLALASQGSTPLLGLCDMIMPQPLPKAAVQSRLNEEVTKSIVEDFFRSEIEQFQKTLVEKAKDIKKPEAKQEVRKYIDEFIKKYGLAHGVSAEFRDQFQMIDDPGLKPLKERFTKDFATQDPKGIMFGAEFFDEVRQFGNQSFNIPHPAYEVKWVGTSTPFSPTAKSEDRFYLAWKVEETEPRTRDFKEAKADVEKAWKLIKARELAAKAAADLQKQLREKTINNLASLKDFAAQQKLDLIEIGPIAMREEDPGARAQGATRYRLPTPPFDKVPFGAQDFCVRLMELRDKPIGETMLLTDIPKNTDYVAVLTERIEPSEVAFQTTYKRLGFERGGGDPLFFEFEQHERIKARAEIIKQLEADAKLTIVDQEELKKYAEKGSEE